MGGRVGRSVGCCGGAEGDASGCYWYGFRSRADGFWCRPVRVSWPGVGLAASVSYVLVPVRLSARAFGGVAGRWGGCFGEYGSAVRAVQPKAGVADALVGVGSVGGAVVAVVVSGSDSVVGGGCGVLGFHQIGVDIARRVCGL